MLRGQGRRDESGNTLPTHCPRKRFRGNVKRAEGVQVQVQGKTAKDAWQWFRLLSLLRFTGVRAETPHWH